MLLVIVLVSCIAGVAAVVQITLGDVTNQSAKQATKVNTAGVSTIDQPKRQAHAHG